MRTCHLEKFHMWRDTVRVINKLTGIHVSGAQDVLSKPIAKEDAKCVYHAIGINIYRIFLIVIQHQVRSLIQPNVSAVHLIVCGPTPERLDGEHPSALPVIIRRGSPQHVIGSR